MEMLAITATESNHNLLCDLTGKEIEASIHWAGLPDVTNHKILILSSGRIEVYPSSEYNEQTLMRLLYRATQACFTHSYNDLPPTAQLIIGGDIIASLEKVKQPLGN